MGITLREKAPARAAGTGRRSGDNTQQPGKIWYSCRSVISAAAGRAEPADEGGCRLGVEATGRGAQRRCAGSRRQQMARSSPRNIGQRCGGLLTHIQTSSCQGSHRQAGRDRADEGRHLGRSVSRIELLGRHIAVQAFKERMPWAWMRPFAPFSSRSKGKASAQPA